jgi:hypothetical protein
MSKRTHALFPRRHTTTVPPSQQYLCTHNIYVYIYIYANRHYYNLLSCPVGKISYSGNTKRQFVLTASVFPGLSPSEYKWPRIYIYTRRAFPPFFFFHTALHPVPSPLPVKGPAARSLPPTGGLFPLSYSFFFFFF